MAYLNNTAKMGKSEFVRLTDQLTEYNVDTTDNLFFIAPPENENCIGCTNFEQAKATHMVCPECVIKGKILPRVPISRRFRLSCLQIKQMILYHFYSVDERGIVKNISVKEVADFLGCKEKTVKRNNEVLSRENFIFLSYASKDRFNVLIVGYTSSYATKEEGGTGYVEMNKNFLNDLVKITNVNGVRIHVRTLLLYDNKTKGGKVDAKVEWNVKSMKQYLPPYLKHMKIIAKELEHDADAFVYTVVGNVVQIDFNEVYSTNAAINKARNSFTERVSKHTEPFNLTTSALSDIMQLTVQYEADPVILAIEHIKDKYPGKKTFANFGGLVRTFIEYRRQGIAL